MIGYSESPLAWGLTQGMARVVGVNLPRAVLEGWLTRAELGQLVARCQSCCAGEDCTNWLAKAQRGALPTFCANKSEIEGLSDGL